MFPWNWPSAAAGATHDRDTNNTRPVSLSPATSIQREQVTLQKLARGQAARAGNTWAPSPSTYQATCPTKPLCTETARPVWQAQGWLISPHMSFGKSPMSSPSLPLTSVPTEWPVPTQGECALRLSFLQKAWRVLFWPQSTAAPGPLQEGAQVPLMQAEGPGPSSAICPGLSSPVTPHLGLGCPKGKGLGKPLQDLRFIPGRCK